jgi:hypothetical protein
VSGELLERSACWELVGAMVVETDGSDRIVLDVARAGEARRRAGGALGGAEDRWPKVAPLARGGKAFVSDKSSHEEGRR